MMDRFLAAQHQDNLTTLSSGDESSRAPPTLRIVIVFLSTVVVLHYRNYDDGHSKVHQTILVSKFCLEQQ
jgi:hypothetical protein